MTDTEKYLSVCCAAALSGKKCADFPVWADAAAFCALASSQGVADIVCRALEDAKGLPAFLSERLKDTREEALRRDLLREEEEKRVFAAFNDADIAYLPLAGGVMRLYYPSADMCAGDGSDLTIDKYARKDARRVMKSCGYALKQSRDGHDIYVNEGGNSFELHCKPEDKSDFHRGLTERALPVDAKGTRLSLSHSDFYVYMISQLARQMRASNAKLKFFADIEVFLSSCGDKLDDEYVCGRLGEMGLDRFEAAVKRAISTLFGGEAASTQTSELADCIFSVGTTPNRERLRKNKKLLSDLGLANIKSGKARMSGGDIAVSLLTIVLLLFAIVFIGLAFFPEEEGRRRAAVGVSGEESAMPAEGSAEGAASGDGSAAAALSGDGDASGEESRYELPKQVYDTIPYSNGVYEGYVTNGLPNGIGTLNLPNGESYSGSFADGKFNGLGVYHYADGKKYEGMWFEGEIFGQGTLTFPDDSFIYANFVDGKPRGECTFQNANGDVYEGELKDGKRSGKGRFVWAGGDVYEGDYVEGEREGRGKYTNVDGDSYEGEWIAGVPNGEGVMLKGGTRCEGIFVQGELEGEGVSVAKNGDKYEGYFVGGICADDSAVYTFANGGKYEGAFADNLFNGKGKYTYPDGDRVEGTFENGVLQGTALYYDKATGISRYIKYKDGKPV